MNGVSAFILLLSGFVGTTQPPSQFDPEPRAVKPSDRLYVLEGADGNVAVLIWDEVAAADTALGMADSGTRIIPGHGPVTDIRGLREWCDMEWDGELTGSFVTSDHPIEEAHRAVSLEQAGSPQR